MAKSISMTDLAKLAGVNISTVSRALDNSPLVNTKTKEKIQQLARETGYSVNARARNLRKQESQTLGLVIPVGPHSNQSVSDPFFMEMVAAVSEAATQYDYDVIISFPRADDEIAERRLLLSGKADGLIIIGQAGRAERLEALGEAISRVVVWGGMFGEPDYTLVGSDNFAGGRQVGEHLVSIGRSRILFLGDIDLPEVKLRYDGLGAALGAHGIAHSAELLCRTSFDSAEAARKLAGVIRSGTAFDAVFASSDVLAIAAMGVLRAAGLAVPQDVAVVGYDNVHQAGAAIPSLTTIDQNIGLGGKLLVELLLKKIAGEEVRSQMTSTELIIRESTGVR